MTKIYTIGANGKTPKTFFSTLEKNGIEVVIDIRLNYKSQLAGFAKGGDDFLGFLLQKVSGIKYVHDDVFAPTDEILDAYHKDKNWDKYVNSFNSLIKYRKMKEHFENSYSSYQKVCFLCAEETPEQCHRRLVAEEMVDAKEVIHL